MSPAPLSPVDGLAVEAELGATVLGRAYRSRENGRTTRVLVLDREDYAWLLRTRYRESRVNVGVPGVRKVGTATAGATSWVSSELEEKTLGEGPIEPSVALEAVRRACRVVAAAHDEGRIHGLITLHDIETSGEVSGFGLAEVARRLAADLYEAHVARAPADVAPEVRKADRTPATASSDVYGLGRTLANALGSALQGDLAAIVEKATSESPEARHSDARALLAALAPVTLPPAPVPLEPLEKGVLGSTKLVATHEFGFDDDSAIVRPAPREPAKAAPPPPPPAPPAPAKAPPPKAPPKPAPSPVAAHDAVADVLKHIESLDKDADDGERVGSITGHIVIPKSIVSDAEIDSGDILGDDFESLEDVRASKKRDGKSGRKKKSLKQSDAELAALGDLDALPPLDDLVSDVSPLASGPSPAMPSGLEGGNVKAAFDDPNASGPYSPNPFGDPLAAPLPPPPPPPRPNPKKNTASTKTRATGWASDDTFGALPGKAPDLAGFDPFGAPPQADPFAPGVPPGFGAPDPFGAPGADPFGSPQPDPFGAPPAFGAPGLDPFGAPPAFGAPQPDPFGAPQADPFGAPPAFGAPQPDPFGAPQADPFGAPPAFGAPGPDPFGAPPAFGDPQPDPFGAPQADPFGAPPAFGAPGPDPFGAPPAFGDPQADPFGAPPAFGAPGPDPFGAPPAFGAPGPDPFGAPPAFGAPQPFGAPQGFGAPDPFAPPGGGFGEPQLDPFASPAEPFAPGGDPFGAAPGGLDPFGAPPATPQGEVPFDPYGKTLGPGQGLAKAAQDESFDPFSEPAPAAGFDPFGAPPAPRGPSMDPFDSAPLAGRPPTPRGQPRPGMPPQQERLLPPISSERQAFIGSKDVDPFSGDEPELEAPAPPPPAGPKKTRVMPGAGGGTCGLTIMGLVGKKKDRAADIVAKIRGIPKAEAVDIVKGNIAKVLENVSRADAEKAAALFQAEGLQVKITEKK